MRVFTWLSEVEVELLCDIGQAWGGVELEFNQA
jgi:hypothetical protein